MTIRIYAILIILTFSSSKLAFSQSSPIIYLFPGQGSDERLFDSLKFEKHQEIIHIKYPTPDKGSSMKEYAHRISNQIDTSRQYIFIGVSLGGMIILELNDFLNPKMSIIISSAKTKLELPFRYRFQTIVPVYKIIPPKVILAGAKILQPIVEPDRNANKATFKKMLSSKDPLYMKRTIEMIIKWDRKTAPAKIIHIHGTNDHTIPLRNVKATYVIKDGSHMMTLTKPAPINKIVNTKLSE